MFETQNSEKRKYKWNWFLENPFKLLTIETLAFEMSTAQFNDLST